MKKYRLFVSCIRGLSLGIILFLFAFVAAYDLLGARPEFVWCVTCFLFVLAAIPCFIGFCYHRYPENARSPLFVFTFPVIAAGFAAYLWRAEISWHGDIVLVSILVIAMILGTWLGALRAVQLMAESKAGYGAYRWFTAMDVTRISYDS